MRNAIVFHSVALYYLHKIKKYFII